MVNREGDMLVVTNRALEALDLALKSRESAPSDCFRLTRQDEGLTVSVERPAADDATFAHGGETVFAVPTYLEDALANRTLDIDENGDLTLK
jgi:hypothetical protein